MTYKHLTISIRGDMRPCKTHYTRVWRIIALQRRVITAEDTKMITTEQQRKELENLARPMIEWLAENFDPHAKLIIDSTSAELLGGSCAFRTDDYIKD